MVWTPQYTLMSRSPGGKQRGGQRKELTKIQNNSCAFFSFYNLRSLPLCVSDDWYSSSRFDLHALAIGKVLVLSNERGHNECEKNLVWCEATHCVYTCDGAGLAHRVLPLTAIRQSKNAPDQTTELSSNWPVTLLRNRIEEINYFNNCFSK